LGKKHVWDKKFLKSPGNCPGVPKKGFSIGENSGKHAQGRERAQNERKDVAFHISWRKIKLFYSLGGIIPGNQFLSFFLFVPELLRVGGECQSGISYSIKYYRVLGNFWKKKFSKIFNPQILSQLLPSGVKTLLYGW